MPIPQGLPTGPEFTNPNPGSTMPPGVPPGSVRTPDGGWRTPGGQVVYIDSFTNDPPVPQGGVPALHQGLPRDYMPQLGIINRFDPYKGQSLTEDQLRKAALAKLRAQQGMSDAGSY